MWGLFRTALYSVVKKLEVNEAMTKDDRRYRLTVSEMVCISVGALGMELSDIRHMYFMYRRVALNAELRCMHDVGWGWGKDQGIITHILKKRRYFTV